MHGQTTQLATAATAFAVEGLRLGSVKANELLSGAPALQAQLDANPRLAAHESVVVNGSTIIRGIEIATRLQAQASRECKAFEDALWGKALGKLIRAAAADPKIDVPELERALAAALPGA
jgi:hypothetical protein